MSRRFVASLTCVVLATLLEAPGRASPIQYTASLTVPLMYWPTTLQVDPQNGGSYALPQASAQSAFSRYDYTSGGAPLDGNVVVTFHATDPANPATDLGTVAVTVPYHGGVGGDGWTADLQGGYFGTGKNSAVNLSPPGTVLPAPLLDLLSHPDRVGLQAVVDGGYESTLDATMYIGGMVAPAPIPEPTVLATLALGMGGLLLHRLRRSGASRRA